MKTLKSVVDELRVELDHWNRTYKTAKQHCESPDNPHDQWYHEKVKSLAINRATTITAMIDAYEKNYSYASEF